MRADLPLPHLNTIWSELTVIRCPTLTAMFKAKFRWMIKLFNKKVI
jgi:hypothetical protein